jgi:hypothetical protein
MERFEQRPGASMTDLGSPAWGTAPDLGLDVVQCTDALERFGRDRRAMRLVDVVERASCMRPAGCLPNAPAVVEIVEAGVGVGLEYP